MKEFIEITLFDGQKVLLSKRHIVVVTRTSRDTTRIVLDIYMQAFTQYKSELPLQYEVNETIDEILKLLE
jgi:hypothetical protein